MHAKECQHLIFPQVLLPNLIWDGYRPPAHQELDNPITILYLSRLEKIKNKIKPLFLFVFIMMSGLENITWKKEKDNLVNKKDNLEKRRKKKRTTQ